MTFLEVLALLIFAHALADYPLQATWIATTKSHKNPHPSGYPWYHSLTAHSIIHGGFVGIITGMLWLGVLEVIAHWLIDFTKSEERISVDVDQALHVVCKVIWAMVFISMNAN
jgi:hypothetical protein